MVDHDCGRHSNVSQVVQECEAVLEIRRGIPDAAFQTQLLHQQV